MLLVLRHCACMWKTRGNRWDATVLLTFRMQQRNSTLSALSITYTLKSISGTTDNASSDGTNNRIRKDGGGGREALWLGSFLVPHQCRHLLFCLRPTFLYYLSVVYPAANFLSFPTSTHFPTSGYESSGTMLESRSHRRTESSISPRSNFYASKSLTFYNLMLCRLFFSCTKTEGSRYHSKWSLQHGTAKDSFCRVKKYCYKLVAEMGSHSYWKWCMKSVGSKICKIEK